MKRNALHPIQRRESMRILTVAFFDDNFGDMLIRTCFLQLTKVALKNLNISDYELDVMPLKKPNEEQVAAADLVIFAGGGLFGLSYLGFAGFIERILDTADAHRIPVIFSSLGINNMDATEENENRLIQILKRPCIKAISVREHADIFEHYAPGHPYEIRPVCDPVVWAGAIYAADIASVLAEKAERKTPVVGLNVVRGGLFKDNGIDWTLTKEEQYLYDLSQRLEEKEIDYRFFTNGSTWDVNTLRHFQKKFQIPREKLIISDNSREVVQAIAGFDAVIAIRMHASIISYALGVPSVNYVWNPKIPELYRKIGYPARAVGAADWTVDGAAMLTDELLAEQDYHPDPDELMTLYRFLYDVYAANLPSNDRQPVYDYETVRARLLEMTVPASEDELDLRTKLQRAESRYFTLFNSDDRKKGEIKRLKKDIDKLKQEKAKLQKDLKAEQKQRAATEKERDAAKAEIKRLNQLFVMRAYNKLTGKNKKK